MLIVHKRPTILVVDDDPPLRSLLCELLEDAGYHVLSAKNGAMALQTLEFITPALVTLDMEMPGMSGSQLLAMLHQRLGARVPAVVIISAYEAIPQVVYGRVQAIVAKPFEITAVLDAIARLVPLNVVV